MSCGNLPDGQGGAEEEQVTMPRRRAHRRSGMTTCQRCHTNQPMYIVRSAVYCRACFEANISSRFVKQLYPPLRPLQSGIKPSQRALFRPPKQDGEALIALSGGAGSMAMLDILIKGDFVGKGLSKVADKTKGEKEIIWDRATVVFVDFGGVVEGEGGKMEMLRGVAEENDLGFWALKAEDVFDAELKRRLGGNLDDPRPESENLAVDFRNHNLPLLSLPSSSSSNPLEKLRTLLASLPPPSRPALLSNILSYILTLVAQTLPNISHLLLGETSTRQAQRVISGTAMGRAWALPLELSAAFDLPADETGKVVLRLQPMKEITIKEAATLCHLHHLATRNERRWGWTGAQKSGAKGKPGVGSLEALTEQFIAGLSVTHPSTVSTINRTGDKLVFPGGKARDTLCPVCQMPVDPSALEWKSRTALTSLPNKLKLPDNPASNSPVDVRTLASSLCYACLTTFTPLTSSRKGVVQLQPVALPLWVSQRVNKQAVSREEMRVGISEFLMSEET